MDYSTLTPYGSWEMLPAHTCAGKHPGRCYTQLHGEIAFAIREKAKLVCNLEYHQGLSCSVFPPHKPRKTAAPSGPIWHSANTRWLLAHFPFGAVWRFPKWPQVVALLVVEEESRWKCKKGIFIVTSLVILGALENVSCYRISTFPSSAASYLSTRDKAVGRWDKHQRMGALAIMGHCHLGWSGTISQEETWVQQMRVWGRESKRDEAAGPESHMCSSVWTENL